MTIRTFLKSIASGVYALMLFSTAYAGGTIDITRSYGPFSLGMSEASFIKLTGETPASCPICLDNERFVALNSKKMQKYVPDDPNKNGVDFFFLDGELYLISRTPEIDSFFKLREEISANFGSPSAQEAQVNNVAVLKWQDNTTQISISYSEIDHEIFSLNIKDMKLAQQRETQEAVLLEQTADIRL
jgi:hypothetical protein